MVDAGIEPTHEEKWEYPPPPPWGLLWESYNNIQLMHSFEVNIRNCQSEHSDVHQGEAECFVI